MYVNINLETGLEINKIYYTKTSYFNSTIS